MMITKDTLLLELCQAGIVDKEVFHYLSNEGYTFVNDVILRSKDSVYWDSQKGEIRSFVAFLINISDFLFSYSNKHIDEDAEAMLPHTLLFTIQSIYEKERKRFNADYVLGISLYDDSDYFIPSFFYQLISNPAVFFDKNAFKTKFKRGDNFILDVDFEYERYKYAMTSIIVKIDNSLGNFPECIYYKRMLDSVICDLNIDDKQINDAEKYASLLNYHPAEIDVIQFDDNNSLVYYNEDIQNKYEELQVPLSVRTRNVIKNYIPSYLDFLPWVIGEKTEYNFRNCGRKTITELEILLIEFRDFYNNYNNDLRNDNKDNNDYINTLSFLIELGLENKTFDNDVCNYLKEIFPRWEDFAAEMQCMEDVSQKIFNHAPRQALDCLNWLAELFSNIILLIANQDNYKSYFSVFFMAQKTLRKYIEENKSELEFHKYITDEKDTLISNTYKLLVSKTSVKCQNVISNYNIDYRTLLSFEGRESEFRNIQQVGRRCAEELVRLLDYFKPRYDSILKDGDDNAKVSNLQTQYPYLNDKDILFINRFDYEHHHLPMFYILSRYFKNTKDRKAQIFASYCGIVKDSAFSLDSLSEKYNLSRERIRQILDKRDFNADDNYIKLIEPQYWQSYDFDTHLSANYTEYLDISKKELLDFSFYTYCNILSLFKNIKLLNVSETGKVLTSIDVEQYNEEDKPFKTFTLDLSYRSFKFGTALNEVGRLLRLHRDIEIKIPLYSYFVTNPDYWINENEDDNVFNNIQHLLEEIITNIYGDLIENHILILPANKLNYADILYNILKDKGERMHIDEIYEHFKTLYPESKYDVPKYLKLYMLRDSRFVNIGRSSFYQLKEWGGYSGSISVLIVEIVSTMNKPILNDHLVQNVLEHRPDSTRKSVLSIINQCIKDKKLVQFYGDYIGAPGKVYDSSFVLLPQNFNEWLEAFKTYTYQHNCFPIGNSRGYEGALYNWYYDTRNFNNLSSEEILSFHALMQELKLVPHNTQERKFLNNCDTFKSFVKESGRMLTKSDDTGLFMWFRINKSKYMEYDDNRHIYFKDLINFLKEDLGF